MIAFRKSRWKLDVRKCNPFSCTHVQSREKESMSLALATTQSSTVEYCSNQKEQVEPQKRDCRDERSCRRATGSFWNVLPFRNAAATTTKWKQRHHETVTQHSTFAIVAARIFEVTSMPAITTVGSSMTTLKLSQQLPVIVMRHLGTTIATPSRFLRRLNYNAA